MRALRRARLILSVLATLSGACGAPTAPAPPSPPEPIGKAAYEARLLAASGLALDADEQVALARRERHFVEERLASLAARIAPGDSWQEVWIRLRADHRDDRAALLDSYRVELARAEAFVAARRLAPLPSTPVEVVEVGNDIIRDHFPLALYLGGRLGVVATDDTLGRHCRACIPPLVVHEAFPGHHVGMQNLPPAVRVSEWPFFVEGWAQYAELLMLEQGYYDDEVEAQLGAWMLVRLRVLRAEVDPLLHSGRLGRQEAVELYRTSALLDDQAAVAEVSRHYTDPTQKASYLLGALQLLELRRLATERRPDLPLLELHREILQRPGTWPAIARSAFGIELVGLGSLAPASRNPTHDASGGDDPPP